MPNRGRLQHCPREPENGNAPTANENSSSADAHVDVPGWATTVRYVEAEWLVHRRKFVDAWVRVLRHLGNIATSRVGGAHSTLKKMLEDCKGDMVRVCYHVLALFERQASDTAANIASEAIRTVMGTVSLTVLNPGDVTVTAFTIKDLMAPLVIPQLCVGHHALRTILEEITRARRPGPLGPCTRYHTVVLGLPCAHVIKERVAAHRPLVASDVASRWHLLPPAPVVSPHLPPAGPVIVRDPHVVRTRGRPAGSSNSTRRDPVRV